MSLRTTTTAAVAIALVTPPLASAHVTVQPPELTAGSYAVVDVRVPNERDDAGTTKVQLQLPPGVSYAAYEPVTNWSVAVTRRKPARPLVIDGEPVPEEVDTITWSGRGRDGVVRPGQFLRFPLSLRVPDGAEGARIAFEALQTYEDGEVVRWIGAADTDRPAPVVTLEAAEDDAGHGGSAHGGGSADAGAEEAGTGGAPARADDEDEDDGSDVLPIAFGAAGLLAGLAGLGVALAGRRRRA